MNVIGHITEGIRLRRKQRRRGQLHGYVRIFRKRDRLLDRNGYRLVPHSLRGYAHVVGDEGELGVALGDRCKQWRLTGGQKHDWKPVLFSRGPEPVGGSVREP